MAKIKLPSLKNCEKGRKLIFAIVLGWRWYISPDQIVPADSPFLLELPILFKVRLSLFVVILDILLMTMPFRFAGHDTGNEYIMISGNVSIADGTKKLFFHSSCFVGGYVWRWDRPP